MSSEHFMGHDDTKMLVIQPPLPLSTRMVMTLHKDRGKDGIFFFASGWSGDTRKRAEQSKSEKEWISVPRQKDKKLLTGEEEMMDSWNKDRPFSGNQTSIKKALSTGPEFPMAITDLADYGFNANKKLSYTANQSLVKKNTDNALKPQMRSTLKTSTVAL